MVDKVGVLLSLKATIVTGFEFGIVQATYAFNILAHMVLNR